MAGGNWDSFGFNEKGESAVEYTSPLGAHVEIYKNQLYVGDLAAWRGGSRFVKPVVMVVVDGAGSYMDVNFTVRRSDEQQACFAAAWTYLEDDAEVGFIGVGVYGFGGDGKWIGVLDSTKEKLFEIMRDEGVPAALLKQIGWME